MWPVSHCGNAMAKVLDYDPKRAIRHLSRADAALGRVIEQIGQFRLEPYPYRDAFGALIRAIVYQQLSGKAAKAIHHRLLGLFPRCRYPRPEQILARTDTDLRAVGLSKAKTIAIKDLAQRALADQIPSNRNLQRLSDDEITECLCAIKGVGPWTAQMLLIFYLGRSDVLPATDLGIRKGYQYTFKKRDLPAPGRILKHGERWRPYRSVASWYLWRASYL